ncbi:uncharacterized protein PFL1_00547 [Pseudozyma flocculosa PF-1]|uniref:NAD(P)-binding protein n=1 Tax=Pseudozyma flocculosa TaxID=84751 RepID=A0A5C3ET45_9BASI|nr:uncharacterized protein PFL1_00547 [Pseudozyma flocculosa PF-1]EPQ32351.1 hypothetical protein PFL1_00547 [Pseudozyma flocculosa PF-1]SPO34687.1 uncharacterized protein PSFLO_00158 [Pseudozyma flocculosa]
MDLVTDLCQRFGVQTPSPDKLALALTSAFVALTIPFVFLFHFSSRPRTQNIPIYRERVLILGASNESSVGEALALQYARRGCRDLVLVARNDQGLERVKQKCILQAQEGEEWEQSEEAPGEEAKQAMATRFHTFKADCTDPNDVDRLRKYVAANLKGLDTLHICFGVSALLPLLGVAGVDPIRPSKAGGEAVSRSVNPDRVGLEAVAAAVSKASHVNVVGTAICLAAFTPMLQTTSSHPAIALTCSAAALVPAPTRSIYASTKAGQLALFRSFAIECLAHASHPAAAAEGGKGRRKVNFLAICPGTISSSFRHSAVDLAPSTSDGTKGGTDMPEDLAWVKGEKMLSAKDVADKTIFKVDRYATGTVTMPALYEAATWIDKVYPAYVQRMARKKYAY